MIGVNGRRSAPATTIIFSSPLLTDRLHWPSPALEKCSASLPDEDTMTMGFVTTDDSITLQDHCHFGSKIVNGNCRNPKPTV